MESLIVLPEAEADLEEAFSWYEEQRPGLGSEFLDEVSAAFNRICAYPRACPSVEANIRRGFTHRFPYSVYFELEASIYVFAVLHQKQAPAAWYSRANN
ncbi:type II toxin-antitoxin system RelE/ParE family toxin [Endozoicomonas sp. G2_2]|uniref:type II toxin-antitoxin system RelE/ParE family toxin n=1 Tax=Salinisphaera sp. TaxID=1914330 RepID=UPI000C5C2215|nr:hypothetical protein [Salinisphaera sp.]MBO9470739.1 type II toxin-antitoxin system RelE/ParE family toxin [Endozoicomonas sp. G2_2]